MTRKQLTQGLRVLHENDEITEIKTSRLGSVTIRYESNGLPATLLVAFANPNPRKKEPVNDSTNKT